METAMKNEEDIYREIQKNVNIIGNFIKMQKENIPLTDVDKYIRKESGIKINALLWVLGEFD